MIVEKHGDIFTSELKALGHGVNGCGLMSHGIAVLFKRKFPKMHVMYIIECLKGNLKGGGFFPYQEKGTWVYNIASQYYPGASAKIEYFEEGLEKAFIFSVENNIPSFAIPQIGHGIGKLDWDQSIKIIEKLAKKYPQVDIEIWYFDK